MPDDRISRADILTPYRQKDFENTLRLLDKYLNQEGSTDREGGWALKMQALCYAAQGLFTRAYPKIDASIEVFQSRQLAADEGSSWLCKGGFYWEELKLDDCRLAYDRADACLKQALAAATAPEVVADIEHRQLLLDIGQAQCYNELHQFDRAEPLFQSVLQKLPATDDYYPVALINLAVGYCYDSLRLKPKYEACRKTLRRAIRLQQRRLRREPDSELAHNSLAGTWGFEPNERSYNPLDITQTDQNYTALVMGDVSMSWQAARAVAQSNIAGLTTPDGGPIVTLSAIQAKVGDVARMPVSLGVLVDKSIFSFQFKFSANPGDLEFLGVSSDNSADNLTILANPEKNLVGGYSTQNLTDGVVCYLDFKILREIADETTVELTEVQLNEEYALASKGTVATQKVYSLQQNNPNPFNPSTTIRYQIPKAGRVALRIYNSAGQLVKTLVEAEQQPNDYQIVWDGKNDNGEAVVSGVYFYRLESGDFGQTNKMVMLK